jgi:hypothetical protein
VCLESSIPMIDLVIINEEGNKGMAYSKWKVFHICNSLNC